MILITEFMDQPAVEQLRTAHSVTYDPSLADTQDKIPGMMGDVTALIVRNRTKVTPALLDAAPKLKCVGRLGVGLDNIDMDACAAKGVTVYPATGANNLCVAEYVISTAMQLLRSAYGSQAAMLAGDWPRQACAGRELSGQTLGLVGFGAIAQDTAKLARGLGMTIAAYDPYLPPGHQAWSGVQRCELADLLPISDVLSLHVPLTDETRHLINADAIGSMKSDAIVINAARGGTLDESALTAALNANRLAGAALDVFEVEPMTAQSGAMFKGVPNLILTPHIAGVTVESNERVSSLIAAKVASHLQA